MKTAAAYIRVSTEEQTEYSPDSQLKKIQEYAHTHHFLLPDHLVFLDEGISGRSARKRPAFMKMIGMAKQSPRPFDLILVWKFSRFARSRQDSILYKSMLRKDCGIHVISVTEHLSDDPTAILIEALLEAMDEYYSINLAQEVRRGMNEKFSRGGVVSAPPFGYRMGETTFVEDPERAPLIPLIYQDFLNGKSCRQIAVRLNELGIHTIRGNLFESRSVEYILTNPTYLGKFRRTVKSDPSGPVMSIVDGHHPALVNQETFDLVQERIHMMHHSHPCHKKTAPARYMLQGLVLCSCCGSTLASSEKGKSLQCHRYAKGLCRQSHHIRLDILNRAVISALKADWNTGKNIISVCRISDSADRDPIPHLLKLEKQRLERARTAYLSGIDSIEDYRKNREDSEKRIQKLEAEQMKKTAEKTFLPECIRIAPNHVFSLLEQTTVSEAAKNDFLRAFIAHITFYRSEHAIKIHYTENHRLR